MISVQANKYLLFQGFHRLYGEGKREQMIKQKTLKITKTITQEPIGAKPSAKETKIA